MAIVSSSVLDDVVQAGGRRSIRLQWVAHTGEKVTKAMLVPPAFNTNAALADGESAVILGLEEVEKGKVEREVERGIAVQTILDNLNHLTTKKALIGIVKRLMLSDDPRFIIQMKSAVVYIKNNFNDAQIRNTLGINQLQLTTYKERVASVLTDTGNTMEGYLSVLDSKKDSLWEDK